MARTATRPPDFEATNDAGKIDLSGVGPGDPDAGGVPFRAR
jgi:hypothetical protein